MRNKIFIFIDVVAPKNFVQIEALYHYGFQPLFFVTKYNAQLHTLLNGTIIQIVLENKFLKRLKQIRTYLKTNKNNIHHLEIYPGGRFSFLYILLAKVYRQKCICVERGDLLYYHKKGYSKLVRFSMWFCYKYSDIIWYREPYMKPILERLNKKLFFLHNAVNAYLNHDSINAEKRDITFLWLNRVIPQRRYDWFIKVLVQPELGHTKNYIVGITPDSSYKNEQEYIINNKPGNLLLSDYSLSPAEFYKRAKFFVLPADVVFANHALLESMSYGVVPLVSNQEGSSLIVEDGKNGFIFNHNKKDFETTVLKAARLTDEEYQRMSSAAAEKIKNEFSHEKYYESINHLYNLI